MKNEMFCEILGDIDDKYVNDVGEIVAERGRTASRTRSGKELLLRKIVAAAAAVAMMVCSGAVGAAAFSREIVVPAEQETVELAELGLTLVLPDSWEGRYEVIKETFEPYDSPMWTFCSKAVYDAKTPADETGEVLYRGMLFTVFQCADWSMSAREFQEESGVAGIGRYLFATEDATYAVMYATDVQFDPDDPAQEEAYQQLFDSMGDIRFLVSGVIE